MIYLLLALTVFFSSYQSILKKEFNNRCTSGIYCFNGIVCLSAMVVFIMINRNFDFTLPLVLYALGFSVAYALSSIFSVLAIRYGSLAKTSLVIAYSLLIPTLYGIIFLKEPINTVKILGFALLIVSLFLTNYEKAEKKSPELSVPEKKVKNQTLLWVFCLVFAFIGNGMCSTIQKMAQGTLQTEQENLFMVVALGVNTIFMFLLSAVTEKIPVIKTAVKKTWIFAVLCGLMNGATNFLVLFLNPRLPASVLFPVISAGGIVFTFIYAILVYHEKFKKLQLIGFLLGVGSIVLLNL